MGLIAIIPGIIAIVLASVGLSQASRSNAPKGVLIAGLIIAILASMISISQVFVAGKIAKTLINGQVRSRISLMMFRIML